MCDRLEHVMRYVRVRFVLNYERFAKQSVLNTLIDQVIGAKRMLEARGEWFIAGWGWVHHPFVARAVVVVLVVDPPIAGSGRRLRISPIHVARAVIVVLVVVSPVAGSSTLMLLVLLLLFSCWTTKRGVFGLRKNAFTLVVVVVVLVVAPSLRRSNQISACTKTKLPSFARCFDVATFAYVDVFVDVVVCYLLFVYGSRFGVLMGVWG